jgi:hypothetical protein
VIDGLYVPLLAGLGAVALLFAGARVLGLPARDLGAALGRAAEWAGLTAILAVLNVAAGFVLVLALRRLGGGFVSLYLNTDLTLLAVAALQASALQWWMEAAERD